MSQIFKRITQIGLVSYDARAMAQRCWNEMDIGPWSFVQLDRETVSDMMVHGRRVDHAMLIGHATFGDIDWEVIQPLDDKSIYAEHLRTKGEGLHHILFGVDNYDNARGLLTAKGFAEIASGRWNGNPYSYFDTQRTLGCLAEIWSPPAIAE